jgi:hypothetical protein
MPVKIRKITQGKNKGKYRTSTPGGVKAKATSKKKAKAQKTLITMKEHGIVPKGGWDKKSNGLQFV